MSKIEWTDRTWNCVVGCSLVSAGCTNCYAMGVAHRGMSAEHRGLTVLRDHGKGPRWTGEVRFLPERLAEPLSWRKPRRVFVNSMSDLFHEALTFHQIAAVFGVMAAAQRHTFQVLTKRPERAREFFAWAKRYGDGYDLVRTIDSSELLACAWEACSGDAWGDDVEPPDLLDAIPGPEVFGRAWPLPNVWLGVSVEDQATADERIPALLTLPAAVRWVSYEPALGPVDFGAWLGAHHDACDCDRCFGVSQNRINWIVVGGESGPKARLFDIAWARSTVEACEAAGTKCFFKQAGSNPTHDGAPVRLRDRKGGDLAELPTDLHVREWPDAS